MIDNQFNLKNLIHKPFLNGMWADLWTKHIAITQALIKEHKLTVADIYTLPGHGLDYVLHMQGRQQLEAPMMQKTTAKASFIPLHKIPYPGGIRIPHLHYNGDVYMLNEKQWGEFSGKIITSLKEKLSRVNTVSVEKLTEISNAVDSM